MPVSRQRLIPGPNLSIRTARPVYYPYDGILAMGGTRARSEGAGDGSALDPAGDQVGRRRVMTNAAPTRNTSPIARCAAASRASTVR
jgi:hypothetical protein